MPAAQGGLVCPWRGIQPPTPSLLPGPSSVATLPERSTHPDTPGASLLHCASHPGRSTRSLITATFLIIVTWMWGRNIWALVMDGLSCSPSREDEAKPTGPSGLEAPGG